MAEKSNTQSNEKNPGNGGSQQASSDDLRSRLEDMHDLAPTASSAGRAAAAAASSSSGGAGASGSSAPRMASAATLQSVKEVKAADLMKLPPSLSDMALTARQLATMLDAGIPLLQSIRLLSQRGSSQKVKDVFAQVTKRVEQGEAFSAALEQHPDVFSPLFIGVVRIGETGGILDKTMRRLAEVLEKRIAIRRQILAALAYPAVALFMAVVVLTLILAIAIPKFEMIYEAQKVPLPAITRFILAVSHVWWVFIPALLVGVGLLVAWGKTEAGKVMYDSLRLSLPILGKLNTKIATARVTRSLANLLDAGIPLLDALGLTARTAENIHVAKSLLRVRDGVERGEKLEAPLRDCAWLPPIAVDMIAIGEEAGSLDFMLDKVASNYESEVDLALRGIASIIEPILIVVMGLVVFVIALGSLLPYFNLINVVTEDVR